MKIGKNLKMHVMYLSEGVNINWEFRIKFPYFTAMLSCAITCYGNLTNSKLSCIPFLTVIVA